MTSAAFSSKGMKAIMIGPRDTEDWSSWRTEIGWPVFRTTAK
jgi:hypothetical protein